MQFFKRNSKIFIITFSTFALSIALIIYTQQNSRLSRKPLKMWNQDQNYKEAALSFLENCEKKDSYSCQLTQLPNVEAQYTDAQIEKSKLLFSKIEKDAVLEARTIVDEITSIEILSQFPRIAPRISMLDFKLLPIHSLLSLSVWAWLLDGNKRNDLETKEFKLLRLGVSNELIRRNYTMGYYYRGRSLKLDGDFMEAFKSFNECALRGNEECILQNALSYAAGIGRIRDMNESVAWLNICRMIGHRSCDDKIGASIDELKNKENFKPDEAEKLSKKYALIVTKNLEISKKCEKTQTLYCNNNICDQVCEIDGVSYGKQPD